MQRSFGNFLQTEGQQQRMAEVLALESQARMLMQQFSETASADSKELNVGGVVREWLVWHCCGSGRGAGGGAGRGSGSLCLWVLATGFLRCYNDCVAVTLCLLPCAAAQGTCHAHHAQAYLALHFVNAR